MKARRCSQCVTCMGPISMRLVYTKCTLQQEILMLRYTTPANNVSGTTCCLAGSIAGRRRGTCCQARQPLMSMNLAKGGWQWACQQLMCRCSLRCLRAAARLAGKPSLPCVACLCSTLIYAHWSLVHVTIWHVTCTCSSACGIWHQTQHLQIADLSEYLFNMHHMPVLVRERIIRSMHTGKFSISCLSATLNVCSLLLRLMLASCHQP